jgi:RNA polymerase sigma factor (TIGR02999 family)
VPEDRAEATQAVLALEAGDDSAASRLMPLVYGELRALAADYLRRERADHTLQPTALVHEAYLKLVDQTQVEWKSRIHFMAVAATAMRRILVDHARRHRAAKRSAGGERVSLESLAESKSEAAVRLTMFDDVLTRLEGTDAELYRIVELRFFSGLSMEEIAQILGMSLPTVERRWRLARAWLSGELKSAEESDS